MSNVVSLEKYKRKRGITPPRSPYFTSNASHEQIMAAIRESQKYLIEPVAGMGKPAYAVVIGYKERRSGRVKLLKDVLCYPSRKSFESMAYRSTLTALALVNRQ